MTPGSNVARLFIYFYVRGYLFKIPFNYSNSSELSDFLAETDCFMYCSSSVSVSALSLPQKTGVWVFEPHGYGSH